jgi:TrmH family RNA methyltransferase
VAVLETRPLERDDLTLPGDAFVVVCDRVQDPGNLGSIVRVADAAGAHAVLISAASCDLYNPKTVRTTMGSLFHLPVIQGGRALELIRWIRSKGITVAAASQHGDLAYSHVDTRGAICWVMGNEAKGLSREALEACDVVVRIPMPGRAESLNVAAAASILMYEVVRQRMAGGDPVRAP